MLYFSCGSHSAFVRVSAGSMPRAWHACDGSHQAGICPAAQPMARSQARNPCFSCVEGVLSLHRLSVKPAGEWLHISPPVLSRREFVVLIAVCPPLVCNCSLCSTKKSVPISLLIMSRAFTLQAPDPAKALAQSISAMDDDVVTEVRKKEAMHHPISSISFM